MKKMRVNLDITVTINADEETHLSDVLHEAAQEMRMTGLEDIHGHGADIEDVELNDWKVEDSR